MIFKDYYKILELKTNRVSSEQIKNAYRLAVKKHHPDLNVEDKLAEEKIKDINEAYRVLSDAVAKKKYDRIWTRNNNQNRQKQNKDNAGKTNSAFDEFFNMFFGTINDKDKEEKQSQKKSEKTPIPGENIQTAIDVDIEEVFYGLDKKMTLKTTDGKTKVFTVAIPAGIHSGEKIRLLGQGKQGVDGGKNGDLFIKVNIKDNDRFKLIGNDIYTNLFLTPWEAALGTKTTVYSIDEGTEINVPEGITSGETITVAGKGYKDTKGGRGNLIAKVSIMIPKNLSQEEKKLFKKLSTVSTFNPRKT